jgi:hypothetical protein
MPARFLALALVLALATPASTVRAQYWSPAVNVDPQTDHDVWVPSMAITPDGTPWIVTGVYPMASRWTETGWTTPAPIPPADGLNHRWPALGCAPDGSLWVMWEADRSYSVFFGMASVWDGSSWSQPETLWVSTQPVANQYDLAPVSRNEAWFVRPANSPFLSVEATHLLDGTKTAYSIPAGTGVGVAKVAVDRDGVVWALWEERPIDPNSTQNFLAYSRFVNGTWEAPQSATGLSYFNRYGLVAAPDNSKWIVSHEQDPRFGLVLNTYGRRWDGSSWTPPQLIGSPFASYDTSQAHLSLSRGSCGNPVATWMRHAIQNPSRYDIVMSEWNGTEWTHPVIVGRPVDSGFKEWPGGASGPNGAWVAYMQDVPPNWNSNVFTTRSLTTPSLEGIADFTATARKPGVRLEWSIPKNLAATRVRLHRADGTYGPDAMLPPQGSTLVEEITGARASKGSVTDRVQPGAYSYWLEAYVSSDLLGWAGPRTVSLVQATASGMRILRDASGFVLSWSKPVAEFASFAIFDVSGRLVRRLSVESGALDVRWDGRNQNGWPVAGGIYFARLEGSSGPMPAVRVLVLR